MRIDGTAIARRILEELKKKSIAPTLAIIQVGDDPASTAYIRQKQNAAAAIGATLIHDRVPAERLNRAIERYNNDASIHGIIVQRPLPTGIRAAAVLPEKDVDGLLPHSPYDAPVAAAVLTILRFAFSQRGEGGTPDKFDQWMRRHTIAVIGRGETAGKPIANGLTNRGYKVTVVHSKTKNPEGIIRGADIVISCVGKPNIVRRKFLKPGVGLVGVGIWRDGAGKLHGDYEEEDIQDIASFYTPTPGGVGPVTVACLMQNLAKAAEKKL